jgi:hypothetical protein
VTEPVFLASQTGRVTAKGIVKSAPKQSIARLVPREATEKGGASTVAITCTVPRAQPALLENPLCGTLKFALERAISTSKQQAGNNFPIFLRV